MRGSLLTRSGCLAPADGGRLFRLAGRAPHRDGGPPGELRPRGVPRTGGPGGQPGSACLVAAVDLQARYGGRSAICGARACEAGASTGPRRRGCVAQYAAVDESAAVPGECCAAVLPEPPVKGHGLLPGSGVASRIGQQILGPDGKLGIPWLGPEPAARRGASSPSSAGAQPHATRVELRIVPESSRASRMNFLGRGKGRCRGGGVGTCTITSALHSAHSAKTNPYLYGRSPAKSGGTKGRSHAAVVSSSVISAVLRAVEPPGAFRAETGSRLPPSVVTSYRRCIGQVTG